MTLKTSHVLFRKLITWRLNYEVVRARILHTASMKLMMLDRVADKMIDGVNPAEQPCQAVESIKSFVKGLAGFIDCKLGMAANVRYHVLGNGK